MKEEWNIFCGKIEISFLVTYVIGTFWYAHAMKQKIIVNYMGVGRGGGQGGGQLPPPPPLEFRLRCISDGLSGQKYIIYTIYLLF